MGAAARTRRCSHWTANYGWQPISERGAIKAPGPPDQGASSTAHGIKLRKLTVDAFNTFYAISFSVLVILMKYLFSVYCMLEGHGRLYFYV